MQASACARWMMIVAVCGAMGCSGVGVTLRHDVDTSKSRILVMPVLLFDGHKLKPGNAAYANPGADETVAKEWVLNVGAENTAAVSKPVLDLLPGAYEGINELVEGLDMGSPRKPGTGVTAFLQVVTTRFFDGALALALVFEDEAEYKASKRVHLNMALYDPKTAAWKWTTKHSYATFCFGLFPASAPYQTVVNELVVESFAQLKVRNAGAVR